jgi:uncharacterized protein YjbI with pentapeptide repeats
MASKQPLPIGFRVKNLFWLKSREQRKDLIRKLNDQRTNRRVDTRTFKDRLEAEKKDPSRNRAYLGGFSVPGGNLEQIFINAGSLKDGNISDSFARHLHLNESKLTNLNARRTEMEVCDWSDTDAAGLNLSQSQQHGLKLNGASMAADGRYPAATLEGMKAPYAKWSYRRQMMVEAPTEIKKANLQGVNKQQVDMEGTDYTGSNLTDSLLNKRIASQLIY